MSALLIVGGMGILFGCYAGWSMCVYQLVLPLMNRLAELEEELLHARRSDTSQRLTS